MEIDLDKTVGKYSLIIGILRRNEEKREIVLRWDNEKLLRRLKAKLAENYFSSKGFKNQKILERFGRHLEKAWNDLANELIEETKSTPNI